MNDSRLDRHLAFLVEIDKLKGIVRATSLIDQSRRENSAEHSWHLAMYALTLAEHASAGIDVARVVQMLLIHDIVSMQEIAPFTGPGIFPSRERRSSGSHLDIRCCPIGKERHCASCGDESEAANGRCPVREVVG
ncbi:MAG: HD domain-containing protein [Burkholderiaceae bacterium]